MRCTRSLLIVVPLTAAVLAGAAGAAPVETVPLSPASSKVHLRAYALGLVSLNGNFTRFDGTLRFDPADAASCTAALTVDVASLTMSNPTARAEIIGPEFLDAARFPTLRFEGKCDTTGVDGMLMMHGVLRPVRLKMSWDRQDVTVVTSLRRADWGITAKPLLVGATVRIRVEATRPR
jgi:polyisoprenoid-binding protein YceI